MEELLKRQKIEIDELNRVIRNYNADGPTRKHKKYLLDKAATFPEMFSVIKENDEQINALKEPSHDEQPYFKEKTFKAIKESFERVMGNVEERLQALGDLNLATASSSAPPTRNEIPTSVGNGSEEHQDTHNLSDENGVDDDDNGHGSGTFGSGLQKDTNDFLTLLYEELMDVIAAARYMDKQSSIGTITAQLTNLNFI